MAKKKGKIFHRCKGENCTSYLRNCLWFRTEKRQKIERYEERSKDKRWVGAKSRRTIYDVQRDLNYIA